VVELNLPLDGQPFHGFWSELGTELKKKKKKKKKIIETANVVPSYCGRGVAVVCDNHWFDVGGGLSMCLVYIYKHFTIPVSLPSRDNIPMNKKV
jgi:hypothetical protein